MSRQKKTAMDQEEFDSKPQSPGAQSASELFDEIERSLLEDGLIPSGRPLLSCAFCGVDSTEWCEFEGGSIQAILCDGCWEEADRMDSILDETGKVVERHLQDGLRHFFFLPPCDRTPGRLLMLGPSVWEELEYFDPHPLDDARLRERLQFVLVFS